MVRPVHNPGQWPREMRAPTAAAYMDEISTEAFLRKVGTVYPGPISGKGERRKWDREELDQTTNHRAARGNGLGAAPSLADDL